MEKIVVENLYKVFGKEPQKAMELLKAGDDKNAIHEKTGMTWASTTPALPSSPAKYS
jgi:glycine betaine/proline transport system ATP-binding protein